jgi:hypothetical protein
LALRWMTLEKVFGVSAVRRKLYLATKHSHMGIDVDGLSRPCTVLLLVDASLECRVLGSRKFFLT